jgi:cytosine/uracil/thiamine/allantoin permease
LGSPAGPQGRPLGSVGGVLIADYYIIRHTRLNLPGL